ncbi:MAG: hypothetical protein KIT25_01375 [Enhydrobacter sp.]|nr:MAG: hypothetical protein KIT25_01375 [Enhydrobacter sp.]
MSIVSRQSFDPLELYASAIDTSDYVSRVAPLVRRLAADVGELLDVGAGGGQLGSVLRDMHRPWSAIEPSPTMRARLSRLHAPPRIVPSDWCDADVAAGAHDSVLAATMPAFFDRTESFLVRCCDWARRNVIWVVPAHHGPRGLCFAGCLPAEWHGEDETPGIDIVLAALTALSRPHDIGFVDWTFSGVVSDLDALAAYLCDRLGWSPADPRRRQLAGHLRAQAQPDAGGYRLEIPRKSAVLVWRRA